MKAPGLGKALGTHGPPGKSTVTLTVAVKGNRNHATPKTMRSPGTSYHVLGITSLLRISSAKRTPRANVLKILSANGTPSEHINGWSFRATARGSQALNSSTALRSMFLLMFSQISQITRSHKHICRLSLLGEGALRSQANLDCLINSVFLFAMGIPGWALEDPRDTPGGPWNGHWDPKAPWNPWREP